MDLTMMRFKNFPGAHFSFLDEYFCVSCAVDFTGVDLRHWWICIRT